MDWGGSDVESRDGEVGMEKVGMEEILMGK